MKGLIKHPNNLHSNSLISLSHNMQHLIPFPIYSATAITSISLPQATWTAKSFY